MSTSTEATVWSSSAIYTAGMTVTEDGVTYVANWWTQGADPATNNGGSGTGEPWTIVSSSNSGTSVPSTPTQLAVTSTSDSTVTLSWAASTVANGGAVTE